MFAHCNGYFFGSAAKLWYVFILAGLFALSAPYLMTLEVTTTRTMVVGSIALFIGLTLKLNYSGIQIDLKNLKYRNCTAIFGIKRGQWKKLTPPEKIVLTSKNVSSWNTPNGISPTFKSNSTIYTIAMFAGTNNPQLFFQTENKKVANKKASELANTLKIELIKKL